ncbi:hypothetical protein INS49_015758 [Diaporthe citri]|uniref:uncharacterized protein n=1 Tax=Diaporthe citri TaxID=83186 RepID=UPI001C81E628|nr:uncharacterized protein INS49_015758 [Diaporthe citri]KAG6356370.1 hypothetical protein INS49_015758 [Diaporthe citri]
MLHILSCNIAEAVIIDCPTSIAATRDLAGWIKGTLPAGCALKLFLATHAHGDHFFGFPGVEVQYAPELYEGLRKVGFPPSPSGTGLPERRVDFRPLPEFNQIDLGDGQVIKVHDIQHAGTHYSSYAHVPGLDFVVAGDIVYNGDCYQYLAEANTTERRDKWIRAVSEIASLDPKIVIPGHSFHVRTGPDVRYARAMLESNSEYIRGFEEELAKVSDAAELFQLMRRRFNRWNLWILKQSCEAAFGVGALCPSEV